MNVMNTVSHVRILKTCKVVVSSNIMPVMESREERWLVIN